MNRMTIYTFLSQIKVSQIPCWSSMRYILSTLVAMEYIDRCIPITYKSKIFI